jgi:uncharacterized membrane protein (UPF0127 family)
MRVRNKTKKTIIIDKARVAKNVKEKVVGLLSSKSPEVLLLKTHFGIHTFGMQYAIDVMVLDSQHKVAATKASLPPNRIFLWNPLHETVIEMPEGMLEKTNTEIGDTIELV